MPIVTASIRHRRGLRSELPASLAEGEIGLTIDTGEVFIGTPSLPQAAARTVFPWQNTRILTEWSPVAEEVLRVVLRDRDIGFDPADPTAGVHPVPVGASPDTQSVRNPELIWRNAGSYGRIRVSRALQEALDDIVSVRSYGARGDGSHDGPSANGADLRFVETQALRVAIIDSVNTRNDPVSPLGWRRRALFWPAGVYEVVSPLPIPPGSRWIGEGPDNTVVVLDREADPTVGFDDCLLFTIDGTLDAGTYISTADVNPTGLDALLANHAYASIDPARTPDDIVIEGIRFVVRGRGPSGIPHDVLRLVRAHRVTFRDCVFEADYTGGKALALPWDPNVDSIAVVIDGAGTADAGHTIRFEGCRFANTTYGALVTDDASGVTFSACTFERLYRGVSLAEAHPGGTIKGLTKGSIGPARILVEGCTFEDVEAEGLVFWGGPGVDRTTSNFLRYGHGLVSFGNRFGNVGNGNFAAAVDSNAAYVISFADTAPWCASIADVFARDMSRDAVGGIVRRVSVRQSGYHLVLNPQDPIVRPGETVTLPAATTVWTSTGIRSSLGAERGFRVYYALREDTGGLPGGLLRRGVLHAVSDGAGIAWSDDYDMIGPSDYIDLQPFLVGASTMELRFRNNDPAANVLMVYRIEYIG